MAMHKIRYLLNNLNGTLYCNEEKDANCISNLACLRKSLKAQTTFKVVVKINLQQNWSYYLWLWLLV
jgi:hypothetical protein